VGSTVTGEGADLQTTTPDSTEAVHRPTRKIFRMRVRLRSGLTAFAHESPPARETHVVFPPRPMPNRHIE
jgi:hypothetical protein